MTIIRGRVGLSHNVNGQPVPIEAGTVTYRRARGGPDGEWVRLPDVVTRTITDGLVAAADLAPAVWEAIIRPAGTTSANAWMITVPDTGTHELADLIPLGVVDGVPTTQGPPGLSAYQVAVKNGFQGTEAEWLESLSSGGVDMSEYADRAEVTELDAATLTAARTYADEAVAGIEIPDVDLTGYATTASVADGDETTLRAAEQYTDEAVSSIPAPEAQRLSISGQQLSISGGNTVTLPAGGGGTDDTIRASGRPDVPSTLSSAAAERVANASPGTEFVSLDGAGTGAWAWRMRGNRKWRVIDGDTTARRLTSPNMTSGFITVQRIGSRVIFGFDGGSYGTWSVGSWTNSGIEAHHLLGAAGAQPIPDGFKAPRPALASVTRDGWPLVGSMIATGNILMTNGIPEGSALLRAELLAVDTQDDWPYTIPPDAA